MKKKILAIVLSVVVTMAYIPSVAFAVTETGETNGTESTESVDKQQVAPATDNSQEKKTETDSKTDNSEVKEYKEKADNDAASSEGEKGEDNNSIDSSNSGNQDDNQKETSLIDLAINLQNYQVTYDSQSIDYDGAVHKQNIAVKKYSFASPLTEGKDYVVTGTTQAEMPGTYEFTVKGIGRYKGEITKSWTIEKISIDDCSIKLSDRTYNGKVQTPEVESAVFTSTGKEIDKSYFTVNGCAKEVGTYTASVTANDIIRGSREDVAWKINKENISNCEIITKDANYDGTVKTPEVTVKLSGQTLSDDDYDIIYGDKKTDAGEYSLDVKGKNNIEGSINVDWKIAPAKITDNDVFLEKRSLQFTGDEQKETVKVIVGGKELSENDFTVSGDTATNKGTYVLKVIGKGNYSGTVEKEWNITDISINIDRQSFDYDGKAHTPSFEVKQGDKKLDSSEYIVKDESTLTATAAGNYIISVQGTGDYSGAYAIIDWTINPAAIKASDFSLEKESYFYDGNDKEVEVKYNGSNKDFAKGKDYEIADESTLSAVLPGNYKVKITGKGNYNGTVILSWKISGFSINSCVIKIDRDSFEYNGSEQGPVVQIRKAIGNTKLTEGEEYTISGTKSATEAGNYKLEINGLEKAGFYGTKVINWQIEKKEVSVEWQYENGVDGDNYVYDGKKHTVSATLNDVEKGDENSYELDVKISGNSVDAGSYDAKVEGFSSGGENYEIGKNATTSYTIDPEQVVPTWSSETKFSYDGLGHSVKATLKAKTGEKLTPVYLYSKKSNKGGYEYSGKKPSEVGQYKVLVSSLTDKNGEDPNNYEVTTDTSAKTKTFSIVKSSSYVDPDDDSEYAREQTGDPEEDINVDESVKSKKSKAGKKNVNTYDAGIKESKTSSALVSDQITDQGFSQNATAGTYLDSGANSGAKSDSGEVVSDESTATNEAIEVFDNSDTPGKKAENNSSWSIIWIALAVLAAGALMIIIIKGASAKKRS